MENLFYNQKPLELVIVSSIFVTLMPNSRMILEVEILVDKGLGTYLRKYGFKPLAHNFFFLFYFFLTQSGMERWMMSLWAMISWRVSVCNIQSL